MKLLKYVVSRFWRKSNHLCGITKHLSVVIFFVLAKWRRGGQQYTIVLYYLVSLGSFAMIKCKPRAGYTQAHMSEGLLYTLIVSNTFVCDANSYSIILGYIHS